MRRILALANQKGGVGKTTTAVNLAVCLAELGKAVLVVDLDPQGNATSALGMAASGASVYELMIDGAEVAEAIVRARERVDLVPSSAALAGAEVELAGITDRREHRLRAALAGKVDGYDYVLVDCPPSLGLLTLNALTAADAVIIPVQCEYFALEGLTRLVTTLDRVRRGLNPALRLEGLVMTMYDPRINLARDVVREVQRHFPAAYRTVIPRSVRLSEAPSHGKAITEYDGSSKAAQAYRDLACEIVGRERDGQT